MYGYEIFHDNLMQSLINTVREGTCSHAYIFEGEKGLGTYDAARLFAAALTCQNTEIAPCTSCPSCVEAKADTNPDIIYIRPDKDKKSIGTDNMRKVEEDAAMKPFAARRKIYIIEDGSLLTEPAQNVFLKTLEEPPEYAAFIIVTENADTLLQTIRSRAVIVHFPNASDAEVREYILKKYPKVQERLDFLVKYCAGVPLKADSVIEDSDFETLRSNSLSSLDFLLSDNVKRALEIQNFTDENKDNFSRVLDFWLSFLRDILLLQTGARENLINVDKRDELRAAASKINPEKIVKIMDKVVTAQKMAARYVNIKAVSLWLAL